MKVLMFGWEYPPHVFGGSTAVKLSWNPTSWIAIGEKVRITMAAAQSELRLLFCLCVSRATITNIAIIAARMADGEAPVTKRNASTAITDSTMRRWRMCR